MLLLLERLPDIAAGSVWAEDAQRLEAVRAALRAESNTVVFMPNHEILGMNSELMQMHLVVPPVRENFSHFDAFDVVLCRNWLTQRVFKQAVSCAVQSGMLAADAAPQIPMVGFCSTVPGAPARSGPIGTQPREQYVFFSPGEQRVNQMPPSDGVFREQHTATCSSCAGAMGGTWPFVASVDRGSKSRANDGIYTSR